MRVYYIGTRIGDFHPHDTEGQLHDLQALVGGFIEPVHLPEFEEQGILLLANEEGLLKGLPVNGNLLPYFFVGSMVALSVDGEEFTGLDEVQVEFMTEWLKASMD